MSDASKFPNTPPHIHRRGRVTIESKIKAVQNRLVNQSEKPVTLVKAPWDTTEHSHRRNSPVTPKKESKP